LSGSGLLSDRMALAEKEAGDLLNLQRRSTDDSQLQNQPEN